jgi:hypothetical protein
MTTSEGILEGGVERFLDSDASRVASKGGRANKQTDLLKVAADAVECKLA